MSASMNLSEYQEALLAVINDSNTLQEEVNELERAQINALKACHISSKQLLQLLKLRPGDEEYIRLEKKVQDDSEHYAESTSELCDKQTQLIRILQKIKQMQNTYHGAIITSLQQQLKDKEEHAVVEHVRDNNL